MRGSLLDGLKVADFSWVGAGPLVSKDLANLGARVVHVESDKKVDPLRYVPPWKGRIPNPAPGPTPAEPRHGNTPPWSLLAEEQTAKKSG